MTASLPDRAQDLRRRLSQIHDLEDKVKEASRLEDLRGELAREVATLKGQLDQRVILQSAGLTVDLPASVEPGRQRAEALLEKFSADKASATLKKGRAWAQLLADADNAGAAVKKAVSDAWRARQSDLFGGEKPAIVRERIAMTQQNAAAFKTYESLYKGFSEAFSALPSDTAAVARAENLAQALRAAAAAFDFDVPADVKAFLTAVQADGAPLALLTDAVKAWLQANNALQNYRIRASAS